MITSKRRAELRAMANILEATVWVGKEGFTDAVKSSIKDAFNTKELVKIALLETCPSSTLEISEQACEALKCEGVQIIGRRLVLYKEQPKKKEAQKKKRVILAKDTKNIRFSKNNTNDKKFSKNRAHKSSK